MEKLSLYDLLSFILPGGTLILLCCLIFGKSFGFDINTLPSESISIIPFLFISYLVGHLISILGKFIENRIIKFKAPWIVYLQKNIADAQLIDKLSFSNFGYGFWDKEKNEVNIEKSDKLFDKIYDLIEVEGKDEKIKVLMSQYAMFRNSISIWSITMVILLFLLLFTYLGKEVSIDKANLWIMLISDFFLAIISMWFLKKRKLLAMEYTYRTFLAMNIQKTFNHE